MKSRKLADKAKPKAAAKSKSTPKATGKAKSLPKATATSKAPAKAAAKTKSPAKSPTKAEPSARKKKSVKLLSGGNPQIPKGNGDAPVQAYIAAMPGWKRTIGKLLDEVIVRTLPHVQKAVKWNSPFYGIEGHGWFLGIHTFTRYVKVAFFRGSSLRPMPPGPSKDKDTRYLDIYEDDEVDEVQLAKWIKQAAALPGGRGLGQ